MRKTMLAAGAAALMLVPAVPASATTSVESCHPPRYDPVRCVCPAAVFVLELITGEGWVCHIY